MVMMVSMMVVMVLMPVFVMMFVCHIFSFYSFLMLQRYEKRAATQLQTATTCVFLQSGCKKQTRLFCISLDFSYLCKQIRHLIL